MTHVSIKDACLTAIDELPEAYGMTVRRFLIDRFGEDVAIGTVYRAMDQLEQDGRVVSRQEPGGPERGGRPKTIWSRT